MDKDEILNRISLEKHTLYFNEINGMYDRALILEEALTEAIDKINNPKKQCDTCERILTPQYYCNSCDNDD